MGVGPSSCGIQSPITGQIFYPPQGRHWGPSRERLRVMLEEWGVGYHEVSDNESPAGVSIVLQDNSKTTRSVAERRLAQGNWPKMFFEMTALSDQQLKHILRKCSRVAFQQPGGPTKNVATTKMHSVI
jgi:hypothetical protein